MKPRLEPVIVTRRLVLRPPRDADLDALVEGIGDLRVSRMLGRVPFPYTRTDGEAFLAAVRRNARSGRSLNLSIFHEGRLVGGIAIGSLPSYCEFGYWLAHSAWGKGFATEAGRAILAYGFDVLGLRLVRSGVLSGNAASMHVQTKLGLRPVGISKRRALARNETVDHIDTVLTRARYEMLAR